MPGVFSYYQGLCSYLQVKELRKALESAFGNNGCELINRNTN